jgi:hypothetical protein
MFRNDICTCVAARPDSCGAIENLEIASVCPFVFKIIRKSNIFLLIKIIGKK